MITIQKYVRAQSLEEAWQLNQNKRNRILPKLWSRPCGISFMDISSGCPSPGT